MAVNVQYKQTFFGREQAGKAVTVVNSKTNTNAVLSSDRNGANALANPVTVGADGVLMFFAPPGRYQLQGGGQTHDITLQGDANAPTEVSTVVTGVRSTGGAAIQAQILQILQARGFLTDNTTP